MHNILAELVGLRGLVPVTRDIGIRFLEVRFQYRDIVPNGGLNFAKFPLTRAHVEVQGRDPVPYWFDSSTKVAIRLLPCNVVHINAKLRVMS